jgi:hypothetical protein
MVRLSAHLRTQAATALVVVLVLAGCGGSKSTSTTTTSASHSATTTSPVQGGSASITTGPVRGSLSAPSHAPIAGKLWPYSVKVTDASGKPLSGTVDTEFLFGGQLVGRESPPTHPLKDGTLHDSVTWPAQSAGQTLTLRTVVHTSAGTITLDWPVTVKR